MRPGICKGCGKPLWCGVCHTAGCPKITALMQRAIEVNRREQLKTRANSTELLDDLLPKFR